MSDKVNKLKSKKEVELSKAEKFYVDSNCGILSLEELCSDLGCEISYIEKYYNECVDKNSRSNTIDKLMIVNSKSGYAIMSKEASEKGESTRKRSQPPLSEHIHKIRKDR